LTYATLVKLYGEDRQSEKRYSPAECIGIRMARIEANALSPRADGMFISMAYLETGMMMPN
jgi:hypothetical protein